MVNKVRFLVLLTMIFGATLGTGCKSSDSPTTATPKATVSRPLVKEVVEWDEYPGRLASPSSVNVSARVSGIVDQAPFREGAFVKEGDVLFVIDQRPFIAELKSKEAGLASAQAAMARAEATFNRYERLKGTKAISEQDYDQAVATFRQARASTTGAEAERDIARLNLEWTRVIAPISGRVSRKYITEGNLVTGGSGQATLLTTIVSVDPIYCYVSVPERSFVTYLKRGQLSQNGTVPAFITIGADTTPTASGAVDFIDNRVDPGTGTIQLRAVFANPNGQLSPGLFARMRIPGDGPYQAILIPDRAIAATQDSRYVLVVDADNTIQQKSVELGSVFGKLRAIRSGLAAEDRVVLTGMQQFRPGTKVEVQNSQISADELKEFTPPPASTPFPAATGTPSPTITPTTKSAVHEAQ